MANPFVYHKRFSAWLWRHRWAWVLIPAIVTFVLFYLVVPDTTPAAELEALQGRKVMLSLGMAALFSMLFGFFVAALHALIHGKIKWLFGVMIFPPLSLVYFWITD